MSKTSYLFHFLLNLTQNFKELDEEGFDEEEKKQNKLANRIQYNGRKKE
jgi:hypothetical protein